MKKLFLLLCCCFILSNGIGQESWRVDKSNSSIQFQVPHLLISTVTGRFNTFNAAISTPKANDFDNAQIEATIPVKSMDTGNEQRDKHLMQSDFFEENTYPEITFKNAILQMGKDNNFTVTGDLTIKDMTQRVTLTGVFGGLAEMWGKQRAGFSAEGKINRFDYNIQYSDKMDTGGWVVGEEITIILNLEFVKQN